MVKTGDEKPKGTENETRNVTIGTTTNVRARLDKAYETYLTALRTLQSDNCRASELAYHNFVSAMQTHGATYQSRSQQEYNNYLVSLQRVHSTGGMETSTAAYNNYLQSLDAIQSDWNQGIQEAYRMYLGALEKAQSGDEAEARLSSAYVNYIKAIKEISASLDPASASPADLVAIHQNIAAAASLGEAGEAIVRARRISSIWLTSTARCVEESSDTSAA